MNDAGVVTSDDPSATTTSSLRVLLYGSTTISVCAVSRIVPFPTAGWSPSCGETEVRPGALVRCNVCVLLKNRPPLRVPVRLVVAPLMPHAVLPGWFSNLTSMLMAWIWMSVVDGVAVHGSPVGTEVAVHTPTGAGPVAVQPLNNAELIDKIEPLAFTVAVNCDTEHDDVIAALENPVLAESSVCSELTTLQFTAEAIDGIANAHTAIAAAKSKTLFLENFFMSICSL
jgi:hypothetical protein